MIRKPTTTAEPDQRDARNPSEDPIELSVVMPCLNEADTLAACIGKAQAALHADGIAGEIIVADNGSRDGSPEIATRLGVRVVQVGARGYGSALMGGIAAARGKYILMADADASYDFGEIPRFLEKLRVGYELVQGCRLRSGGGMVLPGAMPVLHRWVGNPMFSWIARLWFHVPIHDIHCGMRGFRRDFQRELDQRCTGMEFASEMIIKSALREAKIAEVPITLRPDGRHTHAPHLRTFRDGWRHLRFFLVFSPRWLFLIPGVLLILAGLIGYGLGLPGVRLHGIRFDVHTLLFSSLAIICGYQAVLFAVLTKAFAITEDLLPEDARMTRLFRVVNLERGLIVGALATLAGVLLLSGAVNQWRVEHFGDLDYGRTMRWVIPGVTLTTLGFQTVLSSFFLSILGMHRR
jgi:glycosyltransferase involved in cell wall biosynthesis